MRAGVLAGALAGGVAIGAATGHDARACGGCFVRPASQVGTVVTDHRMIFSVSPSQTTLYDQIHYSDSPSDLAWVLPVHGTVNVGVSSDLLFSVLDQNTQTTILAPRYPCPPCPPSVLLPGTAVGNATPSGQGGVLVTAQQVVGPYATVQLHPTSTMDTMAVTSWLQANGYSIPTSVDPVIAAYVSEGFDFLAIKLVPGQGVQAMRPIRITTMGAALSLPLRMVAAGTGAIVGITLWVVATGRYEPQNFPSFTVAASNLVWDWSTSSSNYTTLQTEKEREFQNTAWQIESSLDFSPYTIESAVLQDPNASAYDAVPGADGGPGPTALEVRSQDLNTLFPQGGTSVRITRMRAALSQAALATDLLLQASADQTTLSNTYQTTLSVNANCPVCSPGSFGGGSQIGGNGSVSGGSGPPTGGAIGASSGAVGGSGTSQATGASSASPGQHSSGCSAASSEPAKARLLAGTVGFLALALLRPHRRKRRNDAR